MCSSPPVGACEQSFRLSEISPACQDTHQGWQNGAVLEVTPIAEHLVLRSVTSEMDRWKGSFTCRFLIVMNCLLCLSKVTLKPLKSVRDAPNKGRCTRTRFHTVDIKWYYSLGKHSMKFHNHQPQPPIPSCKFTGQYSSTHQILWCQPVMDYNGK